MNPEQTPTIPQPDPSYFMQPTEPPIDPGAKHRKTLLKLAIIVVVIIGLLTTGLVIFRGSGEQKNLTTSEPSAQAVADQFFSRIAEGKQTDAYNLYSYTSKPSEKDFKQFVANFSATIDFSQCKSTESTTTSPEVYITYTCKARTDGKPDTSFRVTLLKLGDEYKITSCRLVGSS